MNNLIPSYEKKKYINLSNQKAIPQISNLLLETIQIENFQIKRKSPSLDKLIFTSPQSNNILKSPSFHTDKKDYSIEKLENLRRRLHNASIGSFRTKKTSVLESYFPTKTEGNTERKLNIYGSFLKGDQKTGQNLEPLINILEKKWDKKIHDCIEINFVDKFIELQNERLANLFSVYGSTITNLEKEKGSNENLIDILKLFSAEIREISYNYTKFLVKKLPYRAQKKNSRENINKENSIFDECFETLILLYHTNNYKLNPSISNENSNFTQNLTSLKEKLIRIRLSETKGGKFANVIENFSNLFDQLFTKIEELKNENSKNINEMTMMTKIFENSFLFSKQETKDILERPLAQFDSLSKHSLNFLNKFDDLYKSKINELETKNSLYQNEILKLTHNLDEKQIQINELIKKKKKRINLENNQHEDKEIQVNLFINQENNESFSIGNINPLIPYIPQSSTSFKLSDIFINSLIGLILTDKLIDDYSEWTEKTPFCSLKKYLLEWCLVRFGNQSFCQILLSDLLGCLMSLNKENEKIHLFSLLCGLKPEEKQEKKRRNSTLEEKEEEKEYSKDKPLLINDFRLAFFSSHDSFRIILKMAIALRSLREYDSFTPLIPLSENMLKIQITLDEATSIIKSGLADEIDEVFIFEIANNFSITYNPEKNKISRKSLVSGILSPKRGSASVKGKDFSATFMKVKTTNILSIGFESICMFVLDQLAKLFTQKIEFIITSMKLVSSNRRTNDYFIEDFLTIFGKQFPNKSLKWLNSAFSEFIYQNKNHLISNVNDLILNFIDILFKEPLSEKFYAENIEKEREKPLISLGVEEDKEKDVKILRLSSKKKIFQKKTFDEKEKTVNIKEDQRKVYDNNYDFLDSIIVLVETYRNLKELIKKEEINNDILFMNHEIFKKDLTKLPQNFEFNKDFSNQFAGYEKKELLGRLENCWKTLRLIIDCVFSRGEKRKI